MRARQLEEVREVDPDGRIVVHHRLVDTLGRMLKSGTIDQAMHDAGRDFQAAFILAQLDPLRALPILRVPGTGREPDLNERQLHARRRVQQALQSLGGHGSPTGSWAWHVLGCQRSIREWAMRLGWAGRSTCSRRRALRWPHWTSSRGTSATGRTLQLEMIDNLEHKM
jgi:hypothetical protein